ncbi:hypothetical protein HZB01_05190 [Candidatus Woesearchaeota archaeon]|nr:hypothetical protein [Candidatus Woesearchaeota archaeon]
MMGGISLQYLRIISKKEEEQLVKTISSVLKTKFVEKDWSQKQMDNPEREDPKIKKRYYEYTLKVFIECKRDDYGTPSTLVYLKFYDEDFKKQKKEAIIELFKTLCRTDPASINSTFTVRSDEEQYSSERYVLLFTDNFPEGSDKYGKEHILRGFDKIKAEFHEKINGRVLLILKIRTKKAPQNIVKCEGTGFTAPMGGPRIRSLFTGKMVGFGFLASENGIRPGCPGFRVSLSSATRYMYITEVKTSIHPNYYDALWEMADLLHERGFELLCNGTSKEVYPTKNDLVAYPASYGIREYGGIMAHNSKTGKRVYLFKHNSSNKYSSREEQKKYYEKKNPWDPLKRRKESKGAEEYEE